MLHVKDQNILAFHKKYFKYIFCEMRDEMKVTWFLFLLLFLVVVEGLILV